MKHIIKEWRKFLVEKRGFGEGEPPDDTPWYKKRTIVVEDEDNLEQNTYSFDFDNTLIRYKTLEDGDVVYLGPHVKYINILRQLAEDGHQVVIVTSRTPLDKKFPWDDAPTPEELVAELNLPVEIIEYTRGNLKTKKLLDLGVLHHWDDDQEEVDAAIEAGIEATKVPVPGEETQQLRDKWLNHMAKHEDETN
jgi:cellobiose-specific phosphotransferase system component IIB